MLKINVIVAFKLDRLTRPVYYIEKLMKFVNDYECDIDCMADESNTTTSNGRMVMRIMTSISQNKIEKCSKRTKFYIVGAIKSGHIPNRSRLVFKRDNIKVEVKLLENKNKELQQENNKLKSLLNIIVQSLKQLFRKLLKLGTENDKDKIVEEITGYHKLDLYTNKDLHDIADNTPREDEINDYLYTQNYEYNDRDFDI